MKNKYLTKKELEERWTKSLVKKYYPTPHHIDEKRTIYGWVEIHQYSIDEVKKIERRKSFKEALEKAHARRNKAKAYFDSEEGKAMVKAREDRINEKEVQKAKDILGFDEGIEYLKEMNTHNLIEDAIRHYEDRSLRLADKTDVAFLKRITANYVRHELFMYGEGYRNVKRSGAAHNAMYDEINKVVNFKVTEYFK